ncbi:MAG: XRE family transcriptional regulator [Alicyclobacillus sp.]|nr:XRE family transcriptional regulator [Alicyclobacillus sp.]
MIMFGISIYTGNMDIMRIVSTNLRRLREQQRLSISELERRSGVGKATISSLEGGKGNPTVETLWALAKALNVPFGTLVSEASERKVVVRSDEGVKISGTAGYTRFVDRLSSDGCFEIYEMALVPGEERVADPHPEGVLEHLLVVQGRVLTGPAEAPVLLGTGDYITFRGDLQHIYSALDTEARVIVWIEYPLRSTEEHDEHVSTPSSIGGCENFLIKEDIDIRRFVRNHLERSWMDMMHGLNMKRLQFSVENSRVKIELEHIIEQEIQSCGYRRWIQSFVVQDGGRCLTVLSFPKGTFQRAVPLRTRQRLSVQDFGSMSVMEKAEYLLAFGDYGLEPADIDALRLLLKDPAYSTRVLVSDLLTQQGYPTIPIDTQIEIEVVESNGARFKRRSVDEPQRDFSIHGFAMVRPGSARKWVALASMIRKHVACDERPTVVCLDIGMDTSMGLRMVSELDPHLETFTVRPNAVDSKYRKSNGAQQEDETVEDVDFLDLTANRTFPFMISVGALHHMNAYLLLKKASEILMDRVNYSLQTT